MQITNIRLRKITSDTNRIKAVASVTFDDVFVVHDVKVIQGTEGLFISMPSRKSNTGVFRDIAHPITSEFRAELQEKVFEAYNNAEDPVENEKEEKEESAEVQEEVNE